MTSLLKLPSLFISRPVLENSSTSSLDQVTWAMGSESSHCSIIGEPTAMDLYLSGAGTGMILGDGPKGYLDIRGENDNVFK